MTRCPECSTALKQGDISCPSCGASLTIAHPTIKQPSPAASGSRHKSSNSATTTSSGQGSFISGTVLDGRYRIVALLGRGGMGEVYKAEDLKLDHEVALKFLPESVAQDDAALTRFRTEVRIARQVTHQNVCRVFDIGEFEGRHFLTMEYIDGEDLSSLLRRIGRLPADKALEVSRQICAGLAAAHRAGVLHRDLKPANVMIDGRGKARITDFGIAGLEEDLKKGGVIAGTPAYMSPEQITGKDVTARSDIYSLGLVLYEIFTGKQAFSADTIHELIKKHQTETPTNPSVHVKGIDPLVESVIAQCLEKDPKNRPQTALHVAMALPGGNPLQIALDAGQTPSPEMIAATPKKGALTPRVAVLCLIGFIAGMLLNAYFQQSHKAINLVPTVKSPEVLSEKAQAIIRDFGYTETPADIKYSFVSGAALLQYAKENESLPNVREILRSGSFAVNFAYRQSPEPLLSLTIIPQVSYENPPFTVPGMVNVNLDAGGRLTGFRAVPSQALPEASDAQKMDWSKCLAAAGVDPANFELTRPEWTPSFFADEQVAWKGTLNDIPVRFEGAALRGKLIEFQRLHPWDTPMASGVSDEGRQSVYLSAVGFILFLVPLFVGAMLMRRNIKAGRADLKGTFRIALFISFLVLTTYLMRSDHVADVQGEFEIMLRLLSASLFIAGVIGLYYCALEPFVRRWWSEYMISWSRLLAGDFRDPMVGRDILLGGVLTVPNSLAWYACVFAQERISGNKPIIESDSIMIAANGFVKATATWLRMGVDSIGGGLLALLIILLVYFLTRNKKISLAVLFVLIFVTTLPDLPVQTPVMYVALVINAGLFIFIFDRFGLLAAISANFFGPFMTNFPISFNTSSFMFPTSIIILALTIGLAAYACYTSTGGQKLWQGRFFEDAG